MTFANKDKYHGTFESGKFNGQGTFFYANGDIYTGEWQGGKKNGMGTYIHKESGACSKGTWEDNTLVSGAFEDKFTKGGQGNVFEGAFTAAAAGVEYGDGTFTLTSGATCPTPASA